MEGRRQLGNLMMECLTFSEHRPSTSLRPSKEKSCAWNTSICSVGLLGAKLEIPVYGLAFFLVTQPDMGDGVSITDAL
jgi:hypothetical protein